MANALIIKTAEEQLTCSICFELFEHPKALPCLHTFCRKCIDDHIARHAHIDSPPEGFRCPLCRRFIPAPIGYERNSSEWVKYLEGNHVIVNLLEAYKTPTRIENKLLTCTNHEGKELEFYCFDHSKFVCSICALEHRKCEDVQTREDALPKLKPSSANEDISGYEDSEFLKSETLDSCNEIERLIGDRKTRLLNLEEAETEMLMEIRKLRMKINEKLDDEEEKFKMKFTKRKTKETAKLKSELKKSEKIADRAKETMETLQSLDGDNSVEYDQVRKNIQYCKEKLDSARKKSLFNTMKFQPNETVEIFLQNLDSIGRIRVIQSDGLHEEKEETVINRDFVGSHEEPKTSQIRPKPAPRRNVGSVRPSDRIRSVRLSDMSNNAEAISVQEKNDFVISQSCRKQCWITGMAILPNGEIVMTDYHNETVHLYDSDFNVLSIERISPSSYDVTFVSANEILLTRPDAPDGIITYNVKNRRLEPEKALKIGIHARCLNYNNGTLAVCSQNVVEFFTKDNEYWVFRVKKIFATTKFMYVAVDSHKDVVYLTNQQYPDPEVMALSISGQILWRVTHGELNFPSGIAMLDRNIVIASWDQCKLLQFSESGNHIGTIAMINLAFPWKLCIHDNRILVSQHKSTIDGQSKKTIKVFEIV
ncbi:hypothetical protein FSP39_016507 [Pinctada imbricata]|uniref:Uncharacterized protein n=1 Tax=Pinctada imbricata TaxID=66713 RepID=A0AA88XD68_PINIB|nr:hypothetical protein FSP39_016507 [Pinctada imbricata]